MKIKNLVLLAALAGASGGTLTAQTYTPSPADWRQQPIYFVVTDRFADGDPSNNDLGHGEFLPGDIEFYHGGDLKGLTGKLDYIKGLGAGAVWLTPQVQNQWLSPTYGKTRYSGYHGYWAQDFYKVDPHLGTLDDYKNLVREAHKRGLYIIQDIVVNHMGDFYSLDGLNLDQNGILPKPAAPFDDVPKAAEYFHFRGPGKEKSLFTESFGGYLDDLATENPYVRDNLIKIFKYWIKEADIDGYRIDTAKYVRPEFWKVFNKEIRDYAASLGKKDFIIFGEAYDYDNIVKLDLAAADRSTGAFTVIEGVPSFNSMLDFSFCGAITSILAGAPVNGAMMGPMAAGKPRPYGSFKLLDEHFAKGVPENFSPESRGRLVTFIDNHDMARFLAENKANKDEKTAALAVGLMMTLPGLPTLYYGTEQAYNQPKGKKGKGTAFDNRQDLWTSGYKTDSFLYQWMAKLALVRREQPPLATGSYVSRIVDGNNGAIYAFSRMSGDWEVLVVANRSKERQSVDLSRWIKEPAFDLLTLQKVQPQTALEPQAMVILQVKK